MNQLVEEAAQSALRRSLQAGSIQPITRDDLAFSLKQRKASTLEWFQTAKNYATFSDSNKTYQVVLDYMKECESFRIPQSPASQVNAGFSAL